MAKTAETAKIKLAALMAEVQPIIDQHLGMLSSAEVDFILTNYRKYLKIDLERDLEHVRLQFLKSSPFDDILSNKNS